MRTVVWFAVPFAVATALYVYILSPLWGAVTAGICILLLIPLCFLHFSKRKFAVAILVGLSAGFLWNMFYESVFLRPFWNYSGSTVPMSAVVSEYPSDANYGCKVTVSGEINGKTTRVLCYLDKSARSLTPGDRISFTAELRRSDRNKDGENFYYYLSDGVTLIANPKDDIFVEKCRSTPFKYIPVTFGHSVKDAISDCMPQDTAGFVQALVTGDKTAMSSSDRLAVSRAGISHIIAVSGMHVSILIGCLYLIFRQRPVVFAVSSIVVLVFFVFMTGTSPSVVRAAVMQGVLVSAPLFKRENDPPTALCVAMLVILLTNPRAVSNTSFQLSFAAVAGILSVTPWLLERMQSPAWVRKLLKIKIVRSVTRFIISCIAATTGALLFTTPIVSLTFGTFALYGVLTNLLVLWLVSVCFIGGLLVGITGMIYAPVGTAIGSAVSVPVRFVLGVARFVSGLPFASLSTSAPYIRIWLIFVYLVVAAVFIFRRQKQILLPAFTAVCISCAVSVLFLFLDQMPETCKITMLNVGQGQCICMLTPRSSVMYDCGGDNEAEAGMTASAYLNECGAVSLDVLVISHYDKDHCGGVSQLLENTSVGTILMPEYAKDSEWKSEIEAAATQAGTQIYYVTEDSTLTFSDCKAEIYAPVSSKNDNSASLAILYSSGELSILATGDMDTETEKTFLARHQLPETVIFVAGHHGAKNSSGYELLNTVKPQTVLISVGYNSYGHPSDEALNRFASIGAYVYRTDLNGTITIGK